MMHNNVISVPFPFKTIVLPSAESLSLCDIHEAIRSRLPEVLLQSCYLSRTHRASHDCSSDSDFELAPRLLGGKGGFGSQLRAAGGRMKKNKKANTEAMKDTSGRRLRTLKKAQELAEALRDAPDREREERKAKREKLMAIINAEMPGQSRRIKFDDDDYIQQSESILEDLKHAMEGAYHDDSGFDESEDEDEDVGPSSALKSAFESGYAASKTTKQDNEPMLGHSKLDLKNGEAGLDSKGTLSREDAMSKGKGKQASSPKTDTKEQEQVEVKKRKLA